jgi:hypothetical protein
MAWRHEPTNLAVISTDPVFSLAYLFLMAPASTLTPIAKALELEFMTVRLPVPSSKVAHGDRDNNHSD